jgi:hypothetical protein
MTLAAVGSNSFRRRQRIGLVAQAFLPVPKARTGKNACAAKIQTEPEREKLARST